MKSRPVIACAALMASAITVLATVMATTSAAAATTRYETETAPAMCSGAIAANHAGFSGTGFCDGTNALGAAVQFTINAPASGPATLTVRFANGTTTARPADVIVNGTTAQAASFEGTGAWASWATKTLTLPVNSGTNTIRLNPTTANGLPNIDYLEVATASSTPSPTPCSPPSPSPSAQPRITVWLAGDSTMANPSGGVACPVGWGNHLAQYFNANVAVRNSAVGGRSIQTWLYDPNVTSTKNSAGECIVNPLTYSTRWQTMLDATSGMKPGDYLLIHSAASANAVPVIDLHRLSYTLYNSLGFCPFNGDYSSGPVGAFFCNDHTHFESAGARQIAGVVTKALRDQQIALAAYLK